MGCGGAELEVTSVTSPRIRGRDLLLKEQKNFSRGGRTSHSHCAEGAEEGAHPAAPVGGALFSTVACAWSAQSRGRTRPGVADAQAVFPAGQVRRALPTLVPV